MRVTVLESEMEYKKVIMKETYGRKRRCIESRRIYK